MFTLSGLNNSLVLLFVFIAIIIFNHKEMTQDLYGVISREKGNTLDHILLVSFVIFFTIIYKQNVLVYKLISL